MRRHLLARRRLLAAALAAVAVLTGLRALAPPTPSLVAVLVAARDLDAGTLLGPDDLTEQEVPAALAPIRTVQDPLGRTTAGPVAAGEVLSETRLAGPALVRSGSGIVAVPVRLPDAAMAELLHVGDRVDVWAADLQGGAAGTASPVALGVQVLALGAGASDGPGASSVSSVTGLPGGLVVLGAESGDVAALTQASAAAFVTFTWTGR